MKDFKGKTIIIPELDLGTGNQLASRRQVEWPLAARRMRAEQMVFTIVMDALFANSENTPWADDVVLDAVRRIKSRYPGDTLVTLCWPTSPEHWPNTCSFLLEIGAKIAFPPDWTFAERFNVSTRQGRRSRRQTKTCENFHK